MQFNEDTRPPQSQLSSLGGKENTLASFSRKARIDLCSREKKCCSSSDKDLFQKNQTKPRRRRVSLPPDGCKSCRILATVLTGKVREANGCPIASTSAILQWVPSCGRHIQSKFYHAMVLWLFWNNLFIWYTAGRHTHTHHWWILLLLPPAKWWRDLT